MKKIIYVWVLGSLFFILILSSCDFFKTKRANVVLIRGIDVEVHTDLLDEYIEYLGRVKNIGEDRAENVKITINTFNMNNARISVDTRYIAMFLEPGEQEGFELRVYCDVEQYDHYTYKITWSEPD